MFYRPIRKARQGKRTSAVVHFPIWTCPNLRWLDTIRYELLGPSSSRSLTGGLVPSRFEGYLRVWIKALRIIQKELTDFSNPDEPSTKATFDIPEQASPKH